MTRNQREVINRLSNEKFDIGQTIIKAACRTEHKDPKAQALVDRYVELDKKISAAINNCCRG